MPEPFGHGDKTWIAVWGLRGYLEISADTKEQAAYFLCGEFGVKSVKELGTKEFPVQISEKTW